MTIKLTLEPTGAMDSINGIPARIWKGTTDQGHPVEARIAIVDLRTKDEAANAQFAAELREIWPERRLVSFDWRLVV